MKWRIKGTPAFAKPLKLIKRNPTLSTLLCPAPLPSQHLRWPRFSTWNSGATHLYGWCEWCLQVICSLIKIPLIWGFLLKLSHSFESTLQPLTLVIAIPTNIANPIPTPVRCFIHASLRSETTICCHPYNGLGSLWLGVYTIGLFFVSVTEKAAGKSPFRVFRFFSVVTFEPFCVGLSFWAETHFV